MTTAATSLLGLALPVTGELSGTWGDTVNNSITSLLDSAVAGTTTLSTDADVTLTTTTLAANQAREAIILWTAAGTVTRTITAPAQSKTYVVINSSSTQSIKLVGAGPTAGITVLPGESTYAAWNGSDFVKVGEYGGNLTVNSLTTTASTTGSTNKGPLNYGTLSFSDTGIVQSAQTSVNSYFQNVIQNTSAGTAASAEFIAYNDQGTASTNYATVGINSSGYTGTGSINAPGYAYFLSASTDLVLGTIGANGIHFTTNSSATDALAISSAGAVSLPGGTANGVAYLNGSKVVTTGSALVFDGNTLASTALSAAGSTVTYNLLTLKDTGTAYSASNWFGAFTNSTGATVGALYHPEIQSLGVGATSSLIFGIGSTPAEQMRLTSTGLGIGTSSPQARLNVADASSANNGTIWLGSATYYGTLKHNATGTGANEYNVATASGGGHLFQRGGTTLMNLDQNGNLGIGTTSPATKLNIGAGGVLRLNRPDNATYGDIYHGASGTGLVYNDANGDGHFWQLSGTTSLLLNSSGNLGLGVTPSAWDTNARALQIKGAALYELDFGGASTYTFLSNNSYRASGGTDKYLNTYAASLYLQNNGVHSWYNAPSGTAGNAITFTQAMTLSASGSLMVGTTTALGAAATFYGQNATVVIAQGSASGYAGLRFYNDQSSIYRALEIDYMGSTFPGGEMASFSTTGAYPMVFGTNNTERMRIDSSGNLLVGTTSAFSPLTVSGSNRFDTVTFGDIATPANNTGIYLRGTAANGISWANGGYLAFFGGGVGTTERARIDSSGNLLVGVTSTNPAGSGFVLSPSNALAQFTHSTGVGSGGPFLQFLYNASVIGSITQSGTTAVLYNVTSDQRLKENIVDAPEFGSVIDSMQVRSYDWKSDHTHQRAGFIAQELVTVAPEAVHQPADPEEMMAVDYSKLVPILVKEIQSLRARVAQLESK